VALSIAGSDNSAGAGIQADLKTFSRLGCYGLTAVTCVVAEVPGQVAAIQPIKPEIVASQVALSFQAFPVAAAKTGMLFSTPIIEAVARELSATKVPLVIDPVMVASSGDPLLKKSAIAAYQRMLFPLAALITPNLDELQILAGREVRNLEEMKDAGRALVDRHGCAFLLKGGHLRGKLAVDYLATVEGFEEYSAPFIRGVDTHGTGCTYSAAITAGLASGKSLSKSVGAAKRHITRAIAGSLHWGRTCALDQFA
jgi:hydroxymethylpyrimidine/phosphomethylpyrimidine kinase